MPSNADVLARVPLFRDLSPTDLTAIAPRFREDHFPRDAYIFYEADPAERFWVVKDGQVKIVKNGEGGKEIVIEVIPPGEMFGGAAMLMTHQPATAQALAPATALSLSRDEYKRLLRDYPPVSVRVIEMLGERLLGVIRMRMMISERVERRIAHILLKLASKFGEETGEGWAIQASLSRQDIADLADTTIETAIRVMSRFRKDGLVKTLRGGYVVIVDREALRRVGGE
ncbi:MAG: Crp/Fnr family transcriptional regulator [Chloroflexi bacterium]|nr:Crp/Fnr family transcriptional regulator [Chloroflexota bacterium]